MQRRDAGGAWHATVVDAKPLDVLACGPALLDALSEALAVSPRDRLPP